MNHARTILSIISVLLIFIGGIFSLCSIVSFVYEESSFLFFFVGGISFLGLGSWLVFYTRSETPIRAREGFSITSASYVSLGLFTALPIYILSADSISFTDSAFEAVSGLTTTGATVLNGLDDMDRSLLFYRQILQWFGGMGIILLAVAILPLLGVGGMQLFRAESSGSAQTFNVKPRVRETAKTLWLIYVGFTIICAFAYWLAGMSVFDAICHAFTTVAIGGFSTHDESIGYFNSPTIETVCIVFMVLAAINFTLHFTSWRQFWLCSETLVSRILRIRKEKAQTDFRLQTRGGFKQVVLTYLNDYEFRLFGTLTLVLIGLTIVILHSHLTPAEFSLGDAVFHSVSFLTTTGFTTTSYSHWPLACTFLLILLAFAGGCVGSTAGGLKMLRVLILLQQGYRELNRLIYPNGVFLVKLHHDAVPDRVVEAVWGLFALYVTTFFVLLCLVLLISDLDLETSFSAVAACLNNLGPGLGAVSENYADLSDSVKWVLIAAMILGRLEIITLLILFVPKYWRT